jgi:Tol biopolymer transport system component
MRLSNDGKIALKVNDPNGYNTEIYVINTSGIVVNQVLSGIAGVGGLNFTINSQKLAFTRDVSGYEDANYRQLDTRVFSIF